jgi:hypothetical protein
MHSEPEHDPDELRFSVSVLVLGLKAKQTCILICVLRTLNFGCIVFTWTIQYQVWVHFDHPNNIWHSISISSLGSEYFNIQT